MNWDEYNILFHKLNLNRVAFKEVIDCSKEILTLVNAAIDAAAQEKKQWVGLTVHDQNDCLVSADPCECLADSESHQLMDDVEARLKDKNNG